MIVKFSGPDAIIDEMYRIHILTMKYGIKKWL